MLSFPRFLGGFALISGVGLLASASAHELTTRRIEFPSIPGYQTLVCDLHQHTVFSDGSVWPTIRVEEAARDGLTAIAITDHLEYQPHASDIPHPNRNRGYDLALAAGEKAGVIVIRGAEVTRDMPPGHCNAIFLQDANALLKPDPVDALREAARQDAFIFWNHPSWIKQTPDAIARLTPLHEQLLREKLIHGIEVVNETEFSDESLQIALDHNLTILGTSDIHGLIDWKYHVHDGGHRPVTLVFAKHKTEAALKEALIAGRTAVWFNNTLIGRAEWLQPLLEASLTITSASYQPNTSVLVVRLKNASDTDFRLRNTSEYTFHQHADLVEVAAHAETTLTVKTRDPKRPAQLRFEVMNAITAPATHPTLTWTIEAATQ